MMILVSDKMFGFLNFECQTIFASEPFKENEALNWAFQLNLKIKYVKYKKQTVIRMSFAIA